MSFMDEIFNKDERLYRAVYPPEVAEMYWRKDGSVSSAAFADAKGLSVDRGNNRADSDVITSMLTRLSGKIIVFLVEHCIEINAIVLYSPSKNNIYHSEVHGSKATPLLSKSQRLFLARHSKCIT